MMNNLKLTLTQNLPSLTQAKLPSTRLLLIGLGVALAIGGLFNIMALYAALTLFAAIGISYAVQVYHEATSIDFNDIKYSITMEEIIEDLEWGKE